MRRPSDGYLLYDRDPCCYLLATLLSTAEGQYVERDSMNLLRSSINEHDRILDEYA